MMTIEGRDARVRASLSDTPEGVRVELWLRRRAEGEVWALASATVIDMPWHIVLDGVYATLRQREGAP